MQALNSFDRHVAAGILARAALALQNGESSVLSRSIVDNEPALRAALIAEACNKLGLKPDDRSPDVVARLEDYFDAESERLIGEPRVEAAFQRLIARGDFPSDLYDIRIIPNIRDFFGAGFEREKNLIERTIRAPTSEQHFGPPVTPKEPYLISLFARKFTTPFPARDFTMLVAGQRGQQYMFHVHQAWRLYSSRVDIQGAETLVDLLRRFADVYGAEITLDGKRGRFFLTSEQVAPSRIVVEFGRNKKTGKLKEESVTVTQFIQVEPTSAHRYAALVMAIDLNHYRETLSNLDSKEIF